MQPLQFEPRENALFSHFTGISPAPCPDAVLRRERKRLTGISKNAELMILLILGVDPDKVRKKAAPMSEEEWQRLMAAFANHVQFVKYLERRDEQERETRRRLTKPA